MNFSTFNVGEIMFFLGIIIALLVLILHKVRRIHLATYELKRMSAESEVLFAQIQALIGLEKMLELQRPLPPLRNCHGVQFRCVNDCLRENASA